MSRLNLVLVVCFALAVQATFPDDPKPCKYGDAACIIQFVNSILSEKAATGDGDINLAKLDPLSVAKMRIQQGEDSPVNIDLKFTDNQVIGLQAMRFKKIKGFGKNLARKHEILARAPVLSLVGPYSITGKVLILPISGTGKSNMTLVNTDMIISFTGQPLEKDGETYMEATDLKIQAKPERLWYFFSNLFNGDKALGDNMNAFLNDNWHAIFLEVQKSFEASFSQIFQEIITKVFSKYPYAKFFDEHADS